MQISNKILAEFRKQIKYKFGAGEIAQQFTAPTDPAGFFGSPLSTYVVAYNHL